MYEEACEGPEVCARLLDSDQDVYRAVSARLREQDVRGLLTLARGTSGHAATFASYLIMTRLGLPVASLPPSVVTLYRATVRADGLATLAYSQSGQSPDLLESLQSVRPESALTCAVVNDVASPLAQAAEYVFPLHAGPERSVAATKSFIAQLVVTARLVAEWTADEPLGRALASLPSVLQRALHHRWDHAVDQLAQVDRLFVIGRGAGLAIAGEAALKLKETSGIQAEAYSGAELKHGPMALVGAGYPVIVFAPTGYAQESLVQLANALRSMDAKVFLAAPAAIAGADLRIESVDDPDVELVSAIQTFYVFAEALARARGRNPDQPPHLSKVTLTV